MGQNRESEIMGAYRHYTECGVIVHPLEKAVSGVHGTGKKPVFGNYQKQKTPYAESLIQPYAKKDCNLGIVCGKASDVSVFDIDWYRSGIIDYLFRDLDTSKWCFQTHGTKRYGHMIFRYEPALIPGQHQELGFDILAQNIVGSSNNCVCYPSIHEDGTKYEMSIDISDRPSMPLVLTERINSLLNTYAGLTDVLLNCRAVFRDLWESIFKHKRDANYHKVDLFRINDDGRQRSLGMFTELKANGATEEMLLLCCMLVFGDEYNERLSRKELSHLDTSKTMTNARIERDPVLKRFYTGSNFDPFTEPLEKLETKLSPESRDAYETLMCEAPCETLDLVRRAFLIGVFTKQGYVTKEDFTQVEAISNPEPNVKTVWKHEEKYTAPVVNMDSANEVTVDPELLAAFNKAFE
ncbi:bifunctional DNA primase/polymerase [Methanosarcina sp. Z-7115]|uniref:Bifunctional DNA primase/polymerase n=1 Tax=Methanosarcina baikalica TaxID=3073890 RepID=A0ABU2D0G3_9EURY|nr:bifunctional DNA primase/polymerase [Methanosarcina sp. Z-7115]MDR7665481.1 bifunctional DNA primase/polymerase [Methanosarcina sp. Z-7115]